MKFQFLELNKKCIFKNVLNKDADADWEAVGVAQSTGQLLPKLEYMSSNPAIGISLQNIYWLICVYRKDENKEKEAGNNSPLKWSLSTRF